MVRKKKKAPLPASTLIVTQHNKLVEARYSLPLSEQRLLLDLISRVQPGDDEFHEYKISVAEFYNFLGIDPESSYRECRKITKRLLERVVEIEEPDRLIQTHWVATAKYVDSEGYVRLKLEPEMKPYLLQLKSNFTSFRLEMVLSFSSQYTLRIYTLIKQYEQIGEREIEYQELREILKIRPEKYKEFSSFKRCILEQTRKELIEKADLYFDYEVLKLGRRIHAIHFTILHRECPEVPAQQLKANLKAETDVLLGLVPEAHRAKKTVLSAIQRGLKQHGKEYVERNIRYANEKAENSYAGFLVSSMKEDWAHDWMIDQHHEEEAEQARKAREERTKTPEYRSARARGKWNGFNPVDKLVWLTMARQQSGLGDGQALDELAFALFFEHMGISD